MACVCVARFMSYSIVFQLCLSGMHKFDIEEEASKVSKDAAKLANEELAGLMGQLIKYDVFNK